MRLLDILASNGEALSSEYIYLIKLYENEELTQEDLAQIYYIDKAAITRSIRSLEDKGYIKRIKDAIKY